MGALGDYIHLHKNNYLKAGTFHLGEGKNSYQIISNYLQGRTRNIKPVSPETLTALKSRIENDSEAQIRRDKEGTAKEFQAKIDEIYKVLSEIAGKEFLNAISFAGGKENRHYQMSGNLYNKFKNGYGYSKKDIENFKNKKLQIDRAITRINNRKDHQASEEELKEIVDLYNQLNLDNKIDTASKSSLGKIQSAISDLSYDTWLSNVVGDFGEHLVYSARDVSSNLAMRSANNEIQKIAGQERSDIKINTNLISKEITQDKILRTDTLGNSYYLGSTQNKVDVQIVVNEEDVFASAKMYYDFSRDTAILQKDMELLSPLVYLNTTIPEFGNHWLNMHAGRKMNTAAAKNANKVLKEEIAYEALVSGNPFKQNKNVANVFVAIERKSGKVYAASTRDILLTDKFNNIIISPEVSNLIFDNRKSSKFTSRISHLISQVHGTKLRASMKVDLS